MDLHPSDRDHVFVFATAPGGSEAAHFLNPGRADQGAARTAAHWLGLPSAAARRIEVIDPADLEGVGLARYLTDGLGLSETRVQPDKEKLNALKTPVILVRGDVVDDGVREIAQPSGISLVGRYGRDFMPMDLNDPKISADKGHASSSPADATLPSRNATHWLVLVLGGLIVLAALLITAVMLL